MKSCLECGSEQIIPNVKVVDRDGGAKHHMEIAMDAKPNAMFFTETNYFEVKASVCGNCGYVHLFAKNYHLLWKIYQRLQKNVS